MARRGRKRRLELEAEYWRLLAAGVGSVEACRQLGIGRKTGYRWRAENRGLRPDCLPESSRSGRYLSLLECRRIAALRERGLTIRETAGLLGRAPSTVSRELRRNRRPHDYGRYDADLAHHRCRERAGRPRRAKLATDPELRAEVQSKLELEWSPEQIASHLRTRWPGQPERHLCHETIYRALYQGAKGGLSRTLTRKHEREHQRPSPPVPAQAHEPGPLHRGRSTQHGVPAEQPTPQNTELADPCPGIRCRSGTMSLQRCDDHANPP
ncbi:transposase [Streptomyces sp. NPDC096152]|uniref:transposase n=1 Tax=Streptomyces sp. NPDC096152 TaxID=3366078 RepID=UPI00381BEA1C